MDDGEAGDWWMMSGGAGGWWMMEGQEVGG